MSAFSDLLKVRRGEARLTQEELAERSGIKRGHLSVIELGLRTPPMDKIEALADALRLSGPWRTELIEAARAVHSQEQLVEDFHARGKLIDYLERRIADLEAIIGNKETPEESAIRAQLMKLAKEELISRLILAQRAAAYALKQIPRPTRRGKQL